MKHSIRFKITFTLTLMVVLIIGITWVINNTFLSKYYVYNKTKSLTKAYNEIVDIYNHSTSTGYLSDEDTEKMEKLASKYNVEINVINSNLAIIYPALENFGKREKDALEMRMESYILENSNPMVKITQKLAETETYKILRTNDLKFASDYIDLVGFFDNPVDNVIDNTYMGKADNTDQGNAANQSNTAVSGNTGSTADSQTGAVVGGTGSTANDTTGNQNNTTDSSTDNINGNSTDNTTGNSTDNSTGNSADNSTGNSTDNSTGNSTDNSTSNSTDNSTGNSTDNSTSNSTDNSTGNQVNPPDGSTSNPGSNMPSRPNVIQGSNPTYDTAILLRTNLASIEESVEYANKFLAYVGLIVIVIGTLAMFFISRSFTQPIQALSGIAKKMTDLDFEVRYKVNSKDEIGELGNSINSLSDKLETTITELKQANNELQTDIQQKIEIDEMRKEFLSNVSHELKTPISLIQGYAEGLKENINDDQESRDFYCEVIIDEANKMNQMVKKLLSLNELEFGNNQVNFERFDIVALISSVLSATEILFKQKEVTLHFEQTEPLYVWADEYLIEQILTNYISNALNHVNGQRIIEIKLIPREDTVRIAIFNTGDNIPEEDLEKLWIKFYKVDKARTREYGGSGIGLSIVKAIMNSHNRECGVINRPIGVEFWFELDTKSIV